ncbi:AMP-binding protein [Actinosynnema sp. NPDC020468]|uniref:AMP-binding protein n=1 Tax=Actinosynnema sp. NPDC020468 TaxID=3154488 RepID=UPI0033F992E8
MVNVAARIADLAGREGWWSRVAYHEVGGKSWAHGEVHDTSARLATALSARGVHRGQRVVVALPDGAAWVCLFLAIARIGAVAVPVNPNSGAGEHDRLVRDCSPAFAVTAPELAHRFGVTPRSGIDALLDAARTAPPADARPVPDDAPLYIHYTSGTTGDPRGAVHRHGNLAPCHDAVGVRMLRITPDDVSFSLSKLYFAYGFGNSLVYPLHSGSSAVLLPGKPTPAAVAEAVRRHRVTVLHAVPSAYAGLVVDADAEAFRSVRVAVSAGERLTPHLGARARTLLGAPVLDELGSTEIGGACCANTLDRDVPGTIGFPLPGYELRIGREGGPDGEVGELWVRGPSIMTHYHGRPDETARVLVDGWLRTGDRAVRNPDGSYAHAGRADDIEMVGGIKVSPLEVEQVLGEHPEVREVGVAAVPDDSGATRLRAFVVTTTDEVDPALLEAQLLDLARRSLAPFKVPRSVTVVGALPRTPTGKLRRFVLRAGGGDG